VVGAAVFGAVYGVAASLTTNTTVLQGGSANGADFSCQATPLTTTYTVAYDSTIPGFKVSTVKVSGINAPASPATGDCSGKLLTVELTGAADASLAHLTHTIASGDTTYTFTGISGVHAADVAGLHAAITG
jgi:hypothetical protein